MQSSCSYDTQANTIITARRADPTADREEMCLLLTKTDRLTSPQAAVELQSKTDRSRVVAVRNETNLASDNGWIDLSQLGDVRVDVARENLPRVQ